MTFSSQHLPRTPKSLRQLQISQLTILLCEFLLWDSHETLGGVQRCCCCCLLFIFRVLLGLSRLVEQKSRRSWLQSGERSSAVLASIRREILVGGRRIGFGRTYVWRGKGLCISHSLVLWRADLRALSSCVPAEACCATYTTASSVKGKHRADCHVPLGAR